MDPSVIMGLEDSRDRDFMEALYASYKQLIYSEIRKLVRNDWDAEDIQQIVVINLIRKIPLLRTLSRTQLINYIITTSRNAALNHMRDNQRRAREFSFDESSDPLDAAYELDDTLLSFETSESISHAWRALDERSRRLLELKYILERPDEEIARELGVSASSVRMLLTRARRKLRAGIEMRGEQ